jgi:hypothetical protein
MASTRPVASDSLLSVIGTDGAIDLTGEGGARGVSDRSAYLSSDAHLSESAESRFADIDQQIADRFAVGDFAGALSAAELRLGLDPSNERACEFADSSHRRLEARYMTRIGSLDDLFNLAVSKAKLKWLGLDPQATFLLSLVDGQTTVREVLELCGMPRLEAFRLFIELLEAEAIVRVA